jgi:hypothetical protein
MALTFSTAVRQSIDEAFNRALRNGGLTPGAFGVSLTSLLEQGIDSNPSYSSVLVDTVKPLTGNAVTYSGGCIKTTRTVSGTSATLTTSDYVVFMSNDGTRTAALPAASAIGTSFAIVDNSGSANAGHTITVSVTGGANINGASTNVITPGTNFVKYYVSDGTNYWVLGQS